MLYLITPDKLMCYSFAYIIGINYVFHEMGNNILQTFTIIDSDLIQLQLKNLSIYSITDGNYLLNLILSVITLVSIFFLIYYIRKYKNLNLNFSSEQQKTEKIYSKKTEELKRLCNTFEEQLRFTLAGAKAGSIFYNCVTESITFDNRAKEILGFDINENSNKLENWFKKIEDKDAGMLEKNFFDAIKNKHFFETTFQLKPTLDIIKHVTLQCYIVRNKDKQAVALYGLITDITERKTKENNLIQNENKFRLMFEKTNAGIILIDYKGTIISANDATISILETDLKDIIGKNYNDIPFELIHENGKKYLPEERPPFLVFNSGKEIRGRSVGLLRNNKVKWLKIDAIPIKSSGDLWPQMVYIYFEDISPQRKMINELRRSEIKYRSLADNNLIGIFRATLKGEISYVNKSLSDILEYGSQIEVIGKNPMYWFANDQDRRFFYESLKDNIKVENFHTTLRTSKKNIIHVVINAQWINDSISGMVMDINEIIKTRDELKQSKENFLRIFSTIQEGYIQYNIKGKILNINPSALRILGYNQSIDLINKPISKIVFKNPKDLLEILELLKHKENISSYPVEMIKATGKVITADCNIQQLKGKKSSDSFNEITFRDATYSKKVEEALKSLLELNRIMESYNFEEMVNHGLEEAVRLTDSNIGFFHFVDEDTQTISLQTWSKNTLKQCDVPDKTEHYPIEIAGVWVECIQKRKPVIHNNYKELPHKKGLPEGHFPLIREMVVPIFESKKIVAVIGVGNKDEEYNEFDLDQLSLLSENIWSIIRRKRAEDAIKIEKNIAENANKAKSIFLANVSHEIRTPMNAVIGFSELLMNQIDDPIQKNYLESIKTSGSSLLHIINDILDLSKIEAGKMDVNPEPTSINNIFEDIKNIFSLKAHQKGINLIFETDDISGYLFNIDELRVSQILLNLIGNAIKFTNKGHVKICSNILLNDKKKKSCTLNIHVEDTGIGITDDALYTIFESFRQQDEQDIKKYGGTGLGLAISKKLAELMNGIITVESEIDKGSIFSLCIKDVELIKDEKTTAKITSSNIEKIEFLESSILVVDDIIINRELIKGIFKSSKVNIIEAHNGKEAIIKASENLPDLIIMDIRMPVMDGHTASKVLKSDTKTAHIPIIALTASLSSEKNEELISIFDGYLRKPVTVNQIINEVRKFLPFNTSVNLDSYNLNHSHTTDYLNNPEVIQRIIKELIPLYQKAKNADEITDIIEFGEKVLDFGKTHQLNFFINYGNEILKYAKSYDIENVMILLNSFTNIIKSIEEIKF